MDITKFINWENKTRIGGGGFGDVYICKMSTENVAVKVIRVQNYKEEDHKQLFRRMERERQTWKGLENENVLELLGVCYKPELTHDFKIMCFVSHYMKGGESTKYLKNHPETDFRRFVTEIAEGLNYLHSKKVVHGDLRGANVLVDINDEGNAIPRISDFGMSQLIQETDKTVTNDWNQGGRYSPPEYVDYGTGSNLSYAGPKNPTPQGDVWMYSMTLLELYTGEPPYRGMAHHQATIALARKEMADIGEPQHLSFKAHDSVINTLCATNACWAVDPNCRLTMKTIVKYLKDDVDDTESDEEPVPPAQPTVRCLKRRQTSYSTGFSIEGSGNGDSPSPGHSGVFSRDFALATNLLRDIKIKTEPEEHAVDFIPRGVSPLSSSPRSTSSRENSPRTPSPRTPSPRTPSSRMPPPDPYTVQQHQGHSYMTILNNYASKRGSTVEVAEAGSGEPHLPTWTMEIYVDKRLVGTGENRKKKKAQEEAARKALETLASNTPQGQGEEGVIQSLPNYLPIFKKYVREEGLEDRIVWAEPTSSGEAHSLMWHSRVLMDGQEIGSGIRLRKDAAMEAAAKMAALNFNDWPL